MSVLVKVVHLFHSHMRFFLWFAPKRKEKKIKKINFVFLYEYKQTSATGATLTAQPKSFYNI